MFSHPDPSLRVSGNREWAIREGQKRKVRKKGYATSHDETPGSGPGARRDSTARGGLRGGTSQPRTNPVARAPGLHAVAMARRTLGMPAWRLVAGMRGSCLLPIVPSFAVAKAIVQFMYDLQ